MGGGRREKKEQTCDNVVTNSAVLLGKVSSQQKVLIATSRTCANCTTVPPL